VLVDVTGGLDMTLLEVDEAANAISEQVDPEANIIFGAAFDPTLDGMIRVSVVATGMDGASIAAIEPKIERRPLQAEPLRATITPAAEPAGEPVAEPELEPALSLAPQEEEQADIFAAAAAELAEQPQIAEPIAKIVDPSVEELEDEPLFPSSYQEPRKPRGGFLSLFGGRPRYEAQPAPAPAPASRPAASAGGAATAAAQPAATPVEEADANEDLEIPSFLRRLAN